ncbi:MAG TPA: hypothetical protein VF859_10300 [Burkholderiales bacterium]
MRYRMEQSETALRIHIEGVAPGEIQGLVDTLNQCRKSAWACQSGECRNIGSTGVASVDEVVTVTFTPSAGEQLNAKAIEQCLRFTLPNAVREGS